MAESVDFYNAVLSFTVSIITVVTVVIGVFQWKLRQVVKNSNLQINTDNSIKTIMERLQKICDKISSLEEEHVVIQSKYDEVVKELYKLIGEVKVMRDKK